MKTRNRFEMKKNTLTPHFSIHLPEYRVFLAATLLIALGFVFSCDTTNNSKEPEIVGIEVIPEDHRIQEGSTKDFEALARFSTGEKKPFSELDPEKWDWLWVTTEPEVASFTKDGVASGHSTGSTTCYVILGKGQGTSLQSMLKDVLLANPAASRRTLIGRILRVDPIIWDSFGVQVVQPAKLQAIYNLKKLPNQ